MQQTQVRGDSERPGEPALLCAVAPAGAGGKRQLGIVGEVGLSFSPDVFLVFLGSPSFSSWGNGFEKMVRAPLPRFAVFVRSGTAAK